MQEKIEFSSCLIDIDNKIIYNNKNSDDYFHIFMNTVNGVTANVEPKQQSFTLRQQATIVVTHHDIATCSCYLHMGAILHAHPIHGKPHIQRHTEREVSTVLIE